MTIRDVTGSSQLFTPPPMPTAAAWTADQSAPNGFKKDDCLSNLAWNELHAEGQGAENDPSKVQLLVNTLVHDYNSAVTHGQINNPDDVTTDQLTAMATLDPPKS